MRPRRLRLVPPRQPRLVPPRHPPLEAFILRRLEIERLVIKLVVLLPVLPVVVGILGGFRRRGGRGRSPREHRGGGLVRHGSAQPRLGAGSYTGTLVTPVSKQQVRGTSGQNRRMRPACTDTPVHLEQRVARPRPWNVEGGCSGPTSLSMPSRMPSELGPSRGPEAGADGPRTWSAQSGGTFGSVWWLALVSGGSLTSNVLFSRYDVGGWERPRDKTPRTAARAASARTPPPFEPRPSHKSLC